MTTRCPKCDARPAYIQDNKYHCMMCGKEWPVDVNINPVIIKKVFNERKTTMVAEKKEKVSAGKKGPCFNCGRTQFICDKNGFCTTCHNSVKGLFYGTPEYAAALADVNTRVNDPSYRQHVGQAARACRGKKGKPNGTVKKFIDDNCLVDRIKHITTSANKPDVPIDKGKDTAVDLLIAERSTLQDRIFKLNQAIEILSA